VDGAGTRERDEPDERGGTLVKARDVMTEGSDYLKLDATIDEVAKHMAVNDIGALPICAPDGHLQGMLTDRDIVIGVVAADKDPRTTTVSDVIQPVEVVTIGADDSVELAIQTMKDHKVRRLPVIDGTQLVGMVSQGDLAVHLPDDKVGDLVEAISAAP
jgi:CBS domain-containing protein